LKIFEHDIRLGDFDFILNVWCALAKGVAQDYDHVTVLTYASPGEPILGVPRDRGLDRI
jgi:hypothetical protein